MVHLLVLQPPERPFKIWVYNEHPDRKHMAEFNDRFAQGVDSIPTGDTGIGFPSPRLCYHRSRIAQETLQKELLKIGLVQQSLFAEIPNMNRMSHLFGLKKLGWIS